MRDDSDQSLIDRTLGGDAQAFARLVERHYDMIYRVAWRWSGDAGDAEDIAQDVCIKLGQTIGSFKGQSAFTSWLYRVTLNMARDFLRARRRREASVSVMAFSADDEAGLSRQTQEQGGSPEDLAAAADVWRAVRGLPDKQRDAVLLVYAEGLTHAEAAATLDCAENTVSWHIHEARKKLKVVLEG